MYKTFHIYKESATGRLAHITSVKALNRLHALDVVNEGQINKKKYIVSGLRYGTGEDIKSDLPCRFYFNGNITDPKKSIYDHLCGCIMCNERLGISYDGICEKCENIK